MRDLVLSNDPVLLSYLTALLADAEIEAIVLDQYMSVLDGSIGAIPRRLAVMADRYDRAVQVLTEAGEAQHILIRR